MSPANIVDDKQTIANHDLNEITLNRSCLGVILYMISKNDIKIHNFSLHLVNERDYSRESIKYNYIGDRPSRMSLWCIEWRLGYIE